MFDVNTLLYIVLPLTALFWLYGYLSHKYNFWSSQGVKGPKPLIFFGNVLSRVIKNTPELDIEWAQKYGKMYGIYLGLKPSLTIMDHEMVKQVMIKDFHNFVNRQKIKTYHELFNQNLLFAENENWKRARTITSPSFTSGRLREMALLMNQCIDKLVHYIEKTIANKNGLIDTRNVMAGFTIDVIASTSFATDTDANGDRTKRNPFLENGFALFRLNPFRVTASLVLPEFLLSLLNIRTFANPNAFQYFIDLTREIVRQRKSKNSYRSDLIQLMMDAFVEEKDLKRNNFDKLEASIDGSNESNGKMENKAISKKMLSENEIISNSIFFFIAGFETTSSTISHCLYELAFNQDIQERLHLEVTEKLEDYDQNSVEYYDRIMTQIPYLDAVMKETLRKYPPVSELNRRTNVDGYKLGGIRLDMDQEIIVPVHAIHHWPEYYPEPERFNPERFMPENKHLLVPYTYMPFGIGPRNCVGTRFAYQEVKLCIAKLVKLYQFSTTAKTPTKLKYRAATPLLSSCPFELQITKRT